MDEDLPGHQNTHPPRDQGHPHYPIHRQPLQDLRLAILCHPLHQLRDEESECPQQKDLQHHTHHQLGFVLLHKFLHPLEVVAVIVLAGGEADRGCADLAVQLAVLFVLDLLSVKLVVQPGLQAVFVDVFGGA